MPLIRTTQPKIEVEIPPVIEDGTIVNRKAVFLTQEYNDEQQYVNLTVRVEGWSRLEDGAYGQKLSHKIFQTYVENIKADMFTLVDATTGEILGSTSDLLINDETGELHPSIADLPVMKEYEFFDEMAATPIIIRDIIAYKIYQHYTPPTPEPTPSETVTPMPSQSEGATPTPTITATPSESPAPTSTETPSPTSTPTISESGVD